MSTALVAYSQLLREAREKRVVADPAAPLGMGRGR